MKKKKAILIISGSSDQMGLTPGNKIIGGGMMGKVDMEITAFKHQTAFKDKPIVLEVKTLQTTWFDDTYPVTSISYNNYRSTADVTTCTFTS